jgi:tripartite-type tricarboxylate transporter receptor subunit TctC
MKPSQLSIRHLLVGAAVLVTGHAAISASATAQSWPSKPITLIVPFAAGGPSDTIGRLVADHIGRSLGQQIVVENVAGAGGTVGMERAAKSAPDGYTLLTHHSGLTTAPALYANLRIDPKTSFETIGLVNTGPMALLSRKTLEVRDAKELVAWLKTNGEKVTVGHAGVGSNSYVCATVLMQALGTKHAMVAYRGTGPAMNDLVGGQIDVLCDQATTAVPQIQSSTVKAYLVTSQQRLASLKDVPSYTEAGVPGMEVTIWNGLYAPKGTPPEILEKVHSALTKFLADPVIMERFTATGTVPFPSEMRSRQAHAEFLVGQFDFYAKMFAAAGIKKEEAK